MSFFEKIKESQNTNARVSKMNLQRCVVELPIFMPVATHGVLKASHFRVKDIVLGNTFHLRDLNKDLKNYMGIDACLTDSGGFQIISLKNKVDEDGVYFLDFKNNGEIIAEELQQSNDENRENLTNHNQNDIIHKIRDDFCRNVYCFQDYCKGCDFEEQQQKSYLEKYKNYNEYSDNYVLTPEKSIQIQNILNSDIVMQLDDVIRPESPEIRHLIAVKRSIRWLDRLLAANQNNNQAIFPIVQGGLNEDLRNFSVEEILKRTNNKRIKGIAIGGLCGGENKKLFCDVVYKTSKYIKSKFQGPIYVMGVGYPEDVLVSICLGSDMSDCVYPTRTARFGRMFTDFGDINVNTYKSEKNTNENVKEISQNCSFNDCGCRTCSMFSLEYLSNIKKTENFCILLTEHNLFYMQSLTDRIKMAIKKDSLLDFLKKWLEKRYKDKKPDWVEHVYNLLAKK